VTLRFLGEVGDPGAVMDRLGGHSYPAALATIGPLAETVNPDVLWLPVAGVGGLAASVGAALAAPVEDRPFVGHLTLARSRKGPIPRLPLMALSGSWDVGEITLVQSVLGRGGARYEVIGRQPVG
jgi:2'-5' RNA ligase